MSVFKDNRSSPAAKRPFLVVVRAGDGTLHKTWMKKGAARQWDLLIDYYGKDEYRDEFADFINQGGITKYPSMRALDREKPDFLRSYQALFFLDDDIEIAFDDIDRMFALFMSNKLWLAQPSLSLDSYHCHPICVHCAPFELRFTSFVEIMAPIFSQKAFARLVHTFDQSISGFGLDIVWPKILGYPRNRIAVLDAIKVRHTKEISFKDGVFYNFLKSMGIEPFTELRALKTRHGMDPDRDVIRTYEAVVKGGIRCGKKLHAELLSSLTAIREALTDRFDKVSVLEIGSYGIGDDVRKLFSNVKNYIGVDLIAGPGVDLVMPRGVLSLGRQFDVVISIEYLQHNLYYWELFKAMLSHTKPGGLIIFSCASPGRPEHGTARLSPADSPATAAQGQNYYGNLEADDFRRFPFADEFAAWRFYRDTVAHDLYFVAIKKSAESKNWDAVFQNITAKILTVQPKISQTA